MLYLLKRNFDVFAWRFYWRSVNIVNKHVRISVRQQGIRNKAMGECESVLSASLLNSTKIHLPFHPLTYSVYRGRTVIGVILIRKKRHLVIEKGVSVKGFTSFQGIGLWKNPCLEFLNKSGSLKTML